MDILHMSGFKLVFSGVESGRFGNCATIEIKVSTEKTFAVAGDRTPDHSSTHPSRHKFNCQLLFVAIATW